jgi:trans-aconitate 2-methyltransferase
MTDSWSPTQYDRFRTERELPFRDLLAMIADAPAESCADLGCGTGRLTRELHHALRARRTIGVDSSASMLAKSESFREPGMEFVRADLREWEPPEPLDLAFSNAALQWVDDQREAVARLASWLAPGGRLAVQVPANFDHASHRLAAELAREEPFAAALGTWRRGNPVLAPEAYAELLHELGLVDQRVELVVYPHVLPSVAELCEWQRGTLLTVYRDRLGEELYPEFLERFRERLAQRSGTDGPLFYPFKRILFRARRP